MLRAIQEIKPTYVIAENVFGITNIDGGLVFEQVCLDLETQGYEVQPFIIPSASKNAPHVRQRVWFIAYSNGSKSQYDRGTNIEKEREIWGNETSNVFGELCSNGDATDTNGTSTQCGNGEAKKGRENQGGRIKPLGFNMEWEEFPTQSPICGGDDGLPTELDGITFSKWRAESIKGYGNAIVPQVALELFKVIEKINCNLSK
jgi:DNA (cytosine-5)-methyltransferase 1